MSYFSKILEILEKEWIETVELKRGEFLCKKGQNHPNFYFVVKGALHVYMEDKKEQHTFRFGYENRIIAPLDSFISNKPTKFYIQAIKNSELKRISRERFLEVFNANDTYKDLWLEFLKSIVMNQLTREMDVITYSPIERIERLCKRSPHILQEIPHKYVASYLRMQPETFSRLLKNIDFNQL